MGLFDWLFGKKSQSGGVAVAPNRSGVSANPAGVEGLLQRSKELPPNDAAGAAVLLREMLERAVQTSASSQLAELNMALDSMARHYPEAVQQLALDHPDPAVRERAVRLLLERGDPRGLRAAIRAAGSGLAGLAPLVRDLLRDQLAHLGGEDLAALVSLNGKAGPDFADLCRLAEREIQRRAAPGPNSPEENLRRWRQSSAPAWVEARQGHWNHQDWLDLLDSLQRSGPWPMNPEDIGLVLEELKREYQSRR
jgi:hypothetical protein